MTLYFITGNKNKLAEVQALLPQVQQLDIDLAEIQEINPHKIIEAKLQEALKHKEGEFIVEDTSLYFDALNGLPGPLIKWFSHKLGNNGLYNLALSQQNTRAEAKTLIGYAKSKQEIFYFEGTIKGTIISPTGETTFGWDPIFQPEGYTKSFAQMSSDEKRTISMRTIAVKKLKIFLEQ